MKSNEWISVKDILPDKDGPVLIYAPSADKDKPFIMMAWYDPSGFGWTAPKFLLKHITYWMYLPEPPK